VHHPLRDKAEYKKVFKAKAIHESVLEVVCRLARLMGRICGDNMAPGAMKTEKEADELQVEAKLFVTRFVRVLFGAVSTTKMHRLAFHMMQELLLRGNFEEGDTSINEMLHKLLKAMYKVTNKHPDNFQVQMMKCEQTLLHILAEDAEQKLRDVPQEAAFESGSAATKQRRRRRTRHGSSSVADAGSAVVDSVSAEKTSLDDDGYDASDESDRVSDGVGARVHDDAGVDSGFKKSAAAQAMGRATGSVDNDADAGFDSITSDGDDTQTSGDDGSTGGGADTSAECLDVFVRNCSSTSTSSHPAATTTAASSEFSLSFSGSSSTRYSHSSLPSSCDSDGSLPGGSGSGPSARTTVGASLPARRGRKRVARPLTGGVPPSKRARPSAPVAGDKISRAKRSRIRGRRVTVAAAAAADNGRLQQLPEVLGVTDGQTLTVVNSMAFEASFAWGAPGFVQRVRAARSLYNGTPWWDHVLFNDVAQPAVTRLGMARLLIRAIDGERCDLVVVQLLEEADARSGCVLTAFGCGRRKWKMHGQHPALAVVPLASLQRLEHVVPDFEDMCDRLGLYATPATVPDSPHELPLQRFFVNAFFPWTGGCEDDHM